MPRESGLVKFLNQKGCPFASKTDFTLAMAEVSGGKIQANSLNTALSVALRKQEISNIHLHYARLAIRKRCEANGLSPEEIELQTEVFCGLFITRTGPVPEGMVTTVVPSEDENHENGNGKGVGAQVAVEVKKVVASLPPPNGHSHPSEKPTLDPLLVEVGAQILFQDILPPIQAAIDELPFEPSRVLIGLMVTEAMANQMKDMAYRMLLIQGTKSNQEEGKN